MKRTHREESLSFKEKIARLLADAGTGNVRWSTVMFSVFQTKRVERGGAGPCS